MGLSERQDDVIPNRDQWGFLLDGPRSGQVNMELDRTLLDWAERSIDPVTWVRFYGWREPTVSLGKHQKAERAIDPDRCRRRNIEIVYRPTGGRAVLHDRELTYAVVSNDLQLFSSDIAATYLKISRALKSGLLRIGIDTELSGGRHQSKALLNSVSSLCFASASRHELLWQGRKIVGSAQCRLRRSFLQHGSVPLRLNYPLMAELFGMDQDSLRTSIACVGEATAQTVDFAKLAEALQAGFEETFQVQLVPLGNWLEQ